MILLSALRLYGATLTTTAVGAPPRAVTIVAQRVDGVAAAMEWSMAVPGTAEVSLPDGLWEIRVADNDAWAAPVYIRNVDSTTMRVWPTFELQGKTTPISRLRAHFASADDGGVSGEVNCEVSSGTWVCRFPFGRHDVRFTSPGMAPEFRYGISRDSHGADLSLRFVAGASLYGRVEAESGSVEGAEVLLQGSGSRQVTYANRRGLFQFKGLSPGDYAVSARQKALSAPRRSLRIIANANAELSEPLQLDTPKRLTLLVMPPLDPDGKAWRLRLRAAESGDEIEEPVPAIGEWSRPGLGAGSYDVQLIDARGGRWKSETITLTSEDRTVSIAAEGMPISGRVTIGGRPLRARLSFGGEGGRVLSADDDGRFEGHVPFEEGDARRIFVEADTPYVNRIVQAKIDMRPDSGEAYLLLDLPGTTLLGRVLNEDGSPARAFLRLVGVTNPDAFEHAAVESDGSFQIAGLDPGSYKVIAEGYERKSDLLPVELAPNETREIEMMLKREEILRGKMTIGDVPVIDASVLAIPRDTPWASVLPTARTNERGMFEMHLPPGTKTFDGIAVHPAFDTVMARGSVRPGNVVWVQSNQIGGTLVINAEEPHALLLLHKGAEFPVGTVASLSGGTIARERVTLTRMEPGEYVLCSFSKDTCASGYLPPHGSLTLTTTLQR